MNVGARNRFQGVVEEIKRGGVMCQVRVRVEGGALLESVMTNDSAADMDLKVGDKIASR
jgi:molybdopterin-binding protein